MGRGMYDSGMRNGNGWTKKKQVRDRGGTPAVNVCMLYFLKGREVNLDFD